MGLFFATLLGGAGLLGLFGSWRNWNGFQRWGTAAGWGLLLLSCVVWTRSAASVELGLCYALLALSVWAWLFVAGNRERRAVRHTALPAVKVTLPALPAVFGQLLLVLAVVPLAGAAALYASTALVTLLPWQQGNALVLAMLLAPVFWGCMAYWQCADSRPLRPALSAIALLAASAAALNL